MSVHFDQEKGCQVVRISMVLNGKQIRKTKALPAGMDHDFALRFEQQMLDKIDPLRVLMRKLEKIEDDQKGPGLVYAAIAESGPIKIGMTRNTVNARLKSFNTTSIVPWRQVGSVYVANPAGVEQALHSYLAGRRVSTGRELFDITESEARELLSVVAENMEYVNPAMATYFSM